MGDSSTFTVLFLGPQHPLAAHMQSWLTTHLLDSLIWHQADGLAEATAFLQMHPADLILVDGMTQDTAGQGILGRLSGLAPTSARLALIAQPNDSRTLALLQEGAHEVLALAAAPTADAYRAIAQALARCGKSLPALHPIEPAPAPSPVHGKLVHDLNNLITSINGFADLLVSRLAPNDPSRRCADQIRTAGQRAAALLAAQRATPNTAAPSPAPVLPKAA